LHPLRHLIRRRTFVQDGVGDAIDDQGDSVAPLALVVRPEVRVVFAPKPSCRDAVELFQESGRELKSSSFKAIFDQVQRGT